MPRLERLFGTMVGVVLAAFGLWDAWGRFSREDVSKVPYTVVEREGAFEVREYPDAVAVTTVAETEEEAFQRLFAYLDGANDADAEVGMTAPVTTSSGVDVAMSTSVETKTTDVGVTMSFFLPAEYTLETAPTPSDDRVELELHEHRRVAVYRFSWFATESNVDRARRRLENALVDQALDDAGDPELHRYDDPRTPPWQRRNEVVLPLP